MARTLRRLVHKGMEATEEDCAPLFDLLAPWDGGLPRTATAALPFVVQLAADPGMGARVTLIDVLEVLRRAAVRAEPQHIDAGWPEAWQRHQGAIRTLHADPDPVVRRASIPLAVGVAALAELCRTEQDPAVRVPLLLALGAAATEAAAARTKQEAQGLHDEALAVFGTALQDNHPAVRVAAVRAWARIDPEIPVQQVGLLMEALSDPAAPQAFEAAWYTPGADEPSSRDDVISPMADLFYDQPQTGTSFVAGMVEAACRAGDAALCRAALDVAWDLLVRRPSTAAALLPVAGGLLTDPDDGVRLRATHLLAVLGPRAASYADQLAAFLDDPGEDEWIDCTVGEYARWALARIGDARALPGLVERFYEPYRNGYSGGWVVGAPRRPDLDDLLVPLRGHADALMPQLLDVMRHHAAHGQVSGLLTGTFLRVLEAWGEASVPALPDVVPLLDDPCYSLDAAGALAAMGHAAASAEPALRRCSVLDTPANHRKVAWAAWRIGGDGPSALRFFGDEVLREEGPSCPVGLLADFGSAAAPYADRVRQVLDLATGWDRVQAAVTLWAITGESEPSVSALEACVLPFADGRGDGGYGIFGDALRALTRIGTTTPAIRTALHAAKATDRRLSLRDGYEAILQDEELRAAIERVLALDGKPGVEQRPMRRESGCHATGSRATGPAWVRRGDAGGQ
ncbi:hypothetical protein ACSNOH_02460 [Streptomyces sp. URMC 127]|uniref:hypothetical protein n=1 Tax=Streptomyces sp. URMC 127 TaxID=3423402 RepID=UPI003F1CC80A